MAPMFSSSDTRQGDALDALIESRIDLALTPEVKAQLAARGVTEAAARVHLRKRAAEGLVAEFAK